MSEPALRSALWLGPACACCIAIAACAARSSPTHPAAGSAPVDLELTSAEGRRFFLSELGGGPLLLFVFTTYDDACQLGLAPLERVLRAHPKLHALGIAVQPNAEQLLPLYREALAVSFPLAHDPAGLLLHGQSELGKVSTVPTYFLLDDHRQITARHVGLLTQGDLETFVASVR